MELEAITDDLIKRALSAIRYSQELPPEIYRLDFLQGQTPVEQTVAFRRFIQHYVSERLNHFRRFYDISDDKPRDRSELEKTIAGDFRPHDRLLEMWSALYFRYIYEVDVSINLLQAATFMNARSLERTIKIGITKLRDETRRRESLAHQLNHSAYLRARLERPEYQTLIGNEALCGDIVQMLKRREGPHFISIEGIGGIGKTALAHAVAEILANEDTIHDLIWISTRPERLNPDGSLEKFDKAARTLEDIVNRLYLRLNYDQASGKSTSEKLQQVAPVLANKAFLIILDNLEAIADDYRDLLNSLHPLAGRTRFLLTSRESLRAIGFVEVRSVPELSEVDSKALILNELARIGGPHQVVEESHFCQIYESVGGIPLALKLLAAQLADIPLSTCLADLQDARQHQTPEAMFTYIYRRTWRLLSQSARQLLFAIHDVIAPDGAHFTWLRTMGEGSGLTSDQLVSTIQELRRYSLLDVYGALPLYRLHRLTVTFLRNEFNTLDHSL